MESLEVVKVVLLALVVGAALPLAVQLWITLRSVRQAIDRAGHGIDRTLRDVAETSAELRELAASVQQLRSSVRMASAIGAAVGPAVVAAVRAFRDAKCPSCRAILAALQGDRR
jgi:uncharacterized protein YoxC